MDKKNVVSDPDTLPECLEKVKESHNLVVKRLEALTEALRTAPDLTKRLLEISLVRAAEQSTWTAYMALSATVDI